MSTLECTLTPEQKRHALDQALRGSVFSRADQQKRFLRYICEMEIAGRSHEIKEYSIATEALGHSANYSPAEGSSVRSRAHSLRQKLQEYYEIENPGAEIQILLPRGSYVPSFVKRPEPEPLPAEAVPSEPPPAKPDRRLLFAFSAGLVTALALGAGLVTFTGLRMPAGPADSNLTEVWGGMLRPGAEVVVCIGSPPSLLLKSWKMDPTTFRKDIAPAPDEIAKWYAGLRMPDGGGKVYMGNSLNTLLAGDVLAAVRAVRVLSAAGASIQVLPEVSLRPLALRGRNVLLIGSPNYSPYAARVLQGTPFSVYFDPSSHEEVISEGRPEAGAKQIFRPRRDEFGQTVLSYGLLTVVHTPDGNGRTEQTVIFSGIGSAGSQAAMEFFSSGAGLKEFRAHLRQQGHSTVPASYQVIVRCGVDRLLALDWRYETHRVISR